MRRVGVTGSANGCTAAQEQTLRVLLGRFALPAELHHGDCIGVDALANTIARSLGWRTVGHPPTNRLRRAFCRVDEWRPAAPYLERNQHIVEACEVLIAVPHTSEMLRSGTWATVRRARKLERPCTIIYTNGLTIQERGGAQ